MREKVNLKLFVTGMNTRSNLIFAKLIKMCDEQFGKNYNLDLINLKKEPQLATELNILVTPTLVKTSPGSLIRLTGDLTNMNKILLKLNLLPG